MATTAPSEETVQMSLEPGSTGKQEVCAQAVYNLRTVSVADTSKQFVAHLAVFRHSLAYCLLHHLTPVSICTRPCSRLLLTAALLAELQSGSTIYSTGAHFCKNHPTHCNWHFASSVRCCPPERPHVNNSHFVRFDSWLSLSSALVHVSIGLGDAKPEQVPSCQQQVPDDACFIAYLCCLRGSCQH